MTKTLVGVPEKISRADYAHLIESLGLDVADLVSLTFHPTSIQAEVYARNSEGRCYAEGDQIAMHTISIPVED